MRTLSNHDYKLIEQIFSLRQTPLEKSMNAFLRRHYEKVVMTRDYLYAVGDIPVAIVAHLDTVFPEPPRVVYYDEHKNVMWSPDGLGADDRAGVFAIIKIIRSGRRPHIIFTTDEEMGGVGAYGLVKNVKSPFAEMKYIIELDRRGSNDCVFYDCFNKDFTSYIEKFGFVESIGSFSDISIICPSWGVAGVNLSIGYEDEHSVSETLHISRMLDTIDKVNRLLDDAKDAPKFDFIENPYKYHWNTYNVNGAIDNWYYCAGCKNSFSELEMFAVKCLDGFTRFYCPDCLVPDKFDWCTNCGEAYEIDPANPSTLCKDCRRVKVSV